MKASKFIVLAGGILGILAFFLPLVTVQHGGKQLSVSSFQLVKGLEAAQSAIRSDDVKAAAMSSESRAALKGADSDIGAIKTLVFAVFAPALLLVVIGAVAVKRKKFGRLGGFGALLLGLIGFAIGMLLKSAGEGDAGIGVTMLILTGVAGLIGGLLALIKPDRGLATA